MFFLIQQGLPAASKLERQFSYQFPGKDKVKDVLFQDFSYCKVERSKDKLDITSFVTFNCRKEQRPSVIYTEVLSIYNYLNPKKAAIEIQWFDARVQTEAVLARHFFFESNKETVLKVYESLEEPPSSSYIPIGRLVGKIEVECSNEEVYVNIPFENLVPILSNKEDPSCWTYDLFSISSYEILVDKVD